MFKALWKCAKAGAKKIGQAQSFIILSLVYFVFIAPFALAIRRFSDPLGQRQATAWQQLPSGTGWAVGLDAMRQQS